MAASQPDSFKRIDLPAPDSAGYDIAVIIAALGESIPHKDILTKGAEFLEFGKDTSMDSAVPEAVVLAREIETVRHTLYVANHFMVPVYARGLGSGLSGGAVPSRGGIVLDVSPMDRLLAVSPGNKSCRVQPGLTVQKLNEELRGHNLWFPPWPSSHNISSIGGNIAENAGGITTVKYGTTKHWLLGLTCVLPGGGVIRTGCSAVKDVAGFDLTSIICGSEGMLGVLVEAELKLLSPAPAVGTALYCFASDTDCIRAAEAVIAGPVTPRTLEYMDANLIQCVIRQLGQEAKDALGEAAAAGARTSVLAIEADAFSEQDAASQLACIGSLLEQSGGSLIGSTTDRERASALWRVRSELSPSCHQLGEYKVSDDVCVPRDRMLEFIRGVSQISQNVGLTVLNYGHVGDGNFHVTMMFDSKDDPRLPNGLAAIEEICALAVDLGGTITGEHGIGSAKARLLGLQVGQRELGIMRSIKESFDPKGILNPGKWL